VHNKQLAGLRLKSLRLQSNHHTRLEDIGKELSSIGAQISALKTGFEQRLSENDITALRKQMAAVAISNDDVAGQQAVLQSLSFSARHIRHISISEAHGRTYGWVFDGMTASKSSDIPGPATRKLLRWLEEGSGIFWISGKAGSGKSTLVKFIADDHRTLLVLRRWAGSAEVVVACHYFWAAGTALQRSQQGLL